MELTSKHIYERIKIKLSFWTTEVAIIEICVLEIQTILTSFVILRQATSRTFLVL